LISRLRCLFFFYRSGAHRDLHSFPTRRSSDLRRLVEWKVSCSASWGRTSDGTGYGWVLVKRLLPSDSGCIAPTWVELNGVSAISRLRQSRGWLRPSMYLRSNFFPSPRLTVV